MYISEVSGHHSATLAIEKAVKILSPRSEILNINAFNYTNPISEKIINRIYMSVIKSTPQIWDYLYDNPVVVKRLQNIKKTVHKLNSPKLKNLFDKFKPDVVVCTQAFPCGMVADFKETYGSKLPLIAVLTDFIPHSYWVYDTVNFFVTPSDDVSLRLMKKGVPAEKIKSLGIPFDPKFNEQLDSDKLFQKFKLNPKITTLLIMGGGQGLGPIKTIIKSLEKVKNPLQLIVVCGTNKKLYKSLKKKADKLKNGMLIFSYCENINELMGISDIIISKPGGVTTSELLAKNLPLIIVKPLPGQEANNAAYLVEKGAAIRTDNPEDINLVIEDLILRPENLKKIKESEARIGRPNASFDIAKLILELPNA